MQVIDRFSLKRKLQEHEDFGLLGSGCQLSSISKRPFESQHEKIDSQHGCLWSQSISSYEYKQYTGAASSDMKREQCGKLPVVYEQRPANAQTSTTVCDSRVCSHISNGCPGSLSPSSLSDVTGTSRHDSRNHMETDQLPYTSVREECDVKVNKLSCPECFSGKSGHINHIGLGRWKHIDPPSGFCQL